MSQAIRNERRYLSDDEFAVVARSHHPALHDLPDEDLRALLMLLRERRDRATDIARRQRREMRGKAAPSGVTAAADDTGSRHKASILAAALKRVNKESHRRLDRAAQPTQVALARKALAMKRARAGSQRPDPGSTSGAGMRSLPDERGPDLARPMEIGRVSQFVRDAQARRDSR
ncbi:MAG TPA: hypothetical protein VES39_11195 [Rhodospirillales bacterium]|nr:hypothetical protein [Rhodospirillales bacterium]